MSFFSPFTYQPHPQGIMGNLNNSKKSSEINKKCFRIVFSVTSDKVLHLKGD